MFKTRFGKRIAWSDARIIAAAWCLSACSSNGMMDSPVLGGSGIGGVMTASGSPAPATAGTTGPIGMSAAGVMAVASAGRAAPSAGTGPAAVGGIAGVGMMRGGAGTSAAGTMAAASGSAAMPGAGGRSGTGSTLMAGTGAAANGGSGGTGGGVAAAGSGSTVGTGGGSGYDPCPKGGEDCVILPFGDSITFGLGYAGSYRVELFHKAHAAGQHITFSGSLSNGPAMVDGVMFPKANEGHSGWKINQLVPLIPMPALNPKPHIVLLMIGTNDIAQNDDLPNAPKRLGALLDKLIMAVPDARIVVAKLTPLSFGSAGVDTYNKAIEPVIEERAKAGKHISLVEFKGFTTAMLADGVHPNKEGSDLMAGVWYQEIGSVLH